MIDQVKTHEKNNNMNKLYFCSITIHNQIENKQIDPYKTLEQIVC